MNTIKRVQPLFVQTICSRRLLDPDISRLKISNFSSASLSSRFPDSIIRKSRFHCVAAPLPADVVLRNSSSESNPMNYYVQNHKRNFSTSSSLMNLPHYADSPSLRTRILDYWSKAKEAISAFFQKKGYLKQAGVVMYSCCTDPVNHMGFFEILEMPDTFNSWFKVTELHVWMCCVRLGVESYSGKFVRNEIVKNMWADVDKRSLKLGSAALLNRKKSIRELGDQFRANMFAYDEGFLKDDKVLASAVWRNFYGKQCDDPRKVELLIRYIRTQIDNLENQDRYNLLHRGIIKWVPISEIN